MIVGVCNETSNTTFVCLCLSGWEGIYCTTQINYCKNAACKNQGVCRFSYMNYTCECLGNSYTGRHCEIIASQTVIYKTISKSFAYVAITAMASVVMFVIIMDIMKYGFGIDVAYQELKRIRRKIPIKKERQKPVIIRFIYVDTSPSASVDETTV